MTSCFMAGATTCQMCLAGSFAGLEGASMCVACSAGSYSGLSGVSVCTACPPGYYCEGGSSKAGCPMHSSSSASTFHITGCICDAGYSGQNGESCIPCRPGSFCPGASNCSQLTLRLTWLYRSKETGFFYLNLPQPVQSMRNYWAQMESDIWQRVRINSILSPALEEIQLRTAAMHIDRTSFSCTGVETGCGLLDDTYQTDTSYVTLADPSKVSCEFASACACGEAIATSEIDIRGTPFSIKDGQYAWYTCCSYAYSFQSFCADEQHCSAQISGYCGGAVFNGKLRVLNRTQYLQDVQLACSLYPSDPNLQCNGVETPYHCGSAPSIQCPAGSMSLAGDVTLCLFVCIGAEG
jgi:hypothetical protein